MRRSVEMFLVIVAVIVGTAAMLNDNDNDDVELDMDGTAIHSGADELSDNELGTDEKDEGGGSDADNEGDGDEDPDTAKEGYSYEPPRKNVYVPVYVPEKDKKKMKIISVDKGFYIQGGMQLFGKFKSLKHCMKACAITPTCFQGDYNPWLHKCYQHTNYTACQSLKSHPQYIHFSKVPCEVTDAPRGRVTLGVSVPNGIEEKGIDNLQQCIKKCTSAGGGIPATVVHSEGVAAPNLDLAIHSDLNQGCFAIDYDFATHKCFFFQRNLIEVMGTFRFLVECPLSAFAVGNSQGAHQNPTVVHITFCPRPVPA